MPTHTPPYQQTAIRRTEIKGFRIYRDQITRLQASFNGNSSKLIRVLLDSFFDGDLPNVEKKLNRE
jgi:hypothetical protein